MALTQTPGEPYAGRMASPPNPSDPRGFNQDYQAIWQQIIPKIEEESKTEEEFSENLQRVLKALFKHQYGDEPSPDDWKGLQNMMDLPLYMFRKKGSEVMPEVEPGAGEGGEADKLTSGLGHDPR